MYCGMLTIVVLAEHIVGCYHKLEPLVMTSDDPRPLEALRGLQA